MAITFGETTITAMPGTVTRFKRLAVVLAIAIAAVWIAPYATASDSSSPSTADVWTVGEGQTLWSIAAEVAAPGETTRETVDQIKSLNALESSAIRVGDQLLVPLSRE